MDWCELYILCLSDASFQTNPDRALEQREAVKRARKNISEPQKNFSTKENMDRWHVRVSRAYRVSFKLDNPEKAASFQRHIVNDLSVLLEIGAYQCLPPQRQMVHPNSLCRRPWHHRNMERGTEEFSSEGRDFLPRRGIIRSERAIEWL